MDHAFTKILTGSLPFFISKISAAIAAFLSVGNDWFDTPIMRTLQYVFPYFEVVPDTYLYLDVLFSSGPII